TLLSITLKQRRQRQPQNAPASSGVLAQYLEFTTDFGCQNPLGSAASGARKNGFTAQKMSCWQL
ncbi:MAG: hypothetical protein WCB27_21335, partial [Thermoguttaceae bacterium]